MLANPWDDTVAGVAAGVQPMSPLIGSGFEFGIIRNVGANCIYIENPLYVPINVQPGPEFGQPSPPPMGTVQPGITIPAYSWATIPISPADNVLFDARAWQGFVATRGTPPILATPSARGNFVLLNAQAAAPQYPANAIPGPRPARYWFFDTPAPQFNKGSLFRSAPLSYTFTAGFTGTTYDRNYMYFCGSASRQGTFLRSVFATAGQPNSAQFVVNGWVDRMVIIGMMVNVMSSADGGTGTGGPAWLGELGIIYWMEETSGSDGFLYPDVIWDPTGLNQQFFPPLSSVDFHTPSGVNSLLKPGFTGSFYYPLPGVKGLCFCNTSTTAVPVNFTADITVTLIMSEY